MPALTGLFEENPGTKEVGRHVLVIQTGSSAASMQTAIKRFADLAALLLKNNVEHLENFREEFCLEIRADYRSSSCSGQRTSGGDAAS